MSRSKNVQKSKSWTRMDTEDEDRILSDSDLSDRSCRSEEILSELESDLSDWEERGQLQREYDARNEAEKKLQESKKLLG